MNSENYIVIDGKRFELTDEHLKKLGIELPSNPFNRVDKLDLYYYISGRDDICLIYDSFNTDDNSYFDSANYFNDKAFANQVMLHQQLYRKLLRYAWDNESEDIACDDYNDHFYIYLDCHIPNKLTIGRNTYCKNQGTVYFSKLEVAKQAIEDVIKPFMKEHL